MSDPCIQAATGVGSREAELIAGYENPEDFGLAGDAKLGAERLQGRTTDFVGVSFLEEALAASASVGRVVPRQTAHPIMSKRRGGHILVRRPGDVRRRS